MLRTETGLTVRLADYRAPDWLVETVELDFDLHATKTRVRTRLALKPNPQAPSAPLVLDGDGLTLVSLKLDGALLAASEYAATPDTLTIAQPPNGPFTLEIETLVDPKANTQLMGLFRSNATYCTQCEPEGFRRITYFPDRPDVMAVYTTRIEADKAEAPVLLSNGNLTDSGDLPGGRHFTVWNDPFKKPSYLFALVGGNLASIEDKFRTMSGREVTLRIFVEPGKEDRCGYAMDSLKRCMRWDEEAFGREYDLDIFMVVAVSDFNMGAMENKGLNVFNDKLVLASPQSATDADYASIEAVIAHEYFHNWTGDRITCRDWFQLCLKEGLTVFRDQEFTSDMRSRPVKRIADVRGLRGFQFIEDAGPLSHPVRPSTYKEINNFYTSTVYEKGAEVVRMIKTLLGPEKFRAGLDLYFKRHDGEAATVEQFVRCFAETSDRDLTQFMLWYSQAGTPQVVADGSYNARSKTYRLDLTQTIAPTHGQPTKKPMVIPLAVGLLTRNGREMPLTVAGMKVERGILVLDKAAQSFTLTGVDEPPVLSLNRGFSAPIRLESHLTSNDLAVLAAHDSDPFNRWDALQTLAMRDLMASVGSVQPGKIATVDETLLDALAAILGDASLEPAFVALALSPPGESDVAREIGRNINPEAIYQARDRLRRAIGKRLSGELIQIYDRMAVAGPYSPNAESAGRRALRNVSLDLLAKAGHDAGYTRAAKQYGNADNMTDTLAALSTLVTNQAPHADEALADFYKRYSANPLIIDKWMSLQAMVPEAATIARVRELTRHPAFSMANPNRVRALIGAFIQGNPREFNRADGAGYDFAAEMILALDGSNPQVASRLATAFRAWHMLESGRRSLAEGALRRMRAASPLSKDVSDIVERSLHAADNEPQA